MVCTESIAQGDTLAVGLEALVEGGVGIVRADTDVGWPGAASVTISKLWLSVEATKAQPVLNGLATEEISTDLRSEPNVELTRLPEMRHKLLMGSVVNGQGFILDPHEASELLALDPANTDVVRPYLTGSDITDRPDQSPTNWIVCFWDLDIETAAQYSAPFRIVEERVRPERVAGGSEGWRKRIFENWWKFHTLSPGIYRATNELEALIVLPMNSKHVVPCRVPSDWVYGHSTAGVAERRPDFPRSDGIVDPS